MSYELPEMDADTVAFLNSPVEPDPLPEGVAESRVVTATVHEVDEDYVYLKIDDENFGRCELQEATAVGVSELPEIGTTVRCLLEARTDETTWEVSVAKATLLDTFDMVEGWAKGSEPVHGRVNLAVRGGFMVGVAGVRCFLPGRESGIRRVESLAAVGQEFDFDVIRFERKTGEPTLSRKRLASSERKAAEDARIDELEVGQVIEGRVSSVRAFGVFVDLGGVDGMCHVSELSLQHVADPADIVRPGQMLTVTIASIDKEKGRIGLSRRDQLNAEQRDRLGSIDAGAVIEGRVTRIADFGAFVEVVEDVEGLCHVSEMSWTSRISHPSEVLSEGDVVKMKILAVDAESGRVSLSLRALEDNPWASIESDFPAGSTATGEITRVEDYGLFVKLADGVEGLCHIGDLTWEGRPDRPSDVADYKVGDALEVKVLSIDTSRSRISLGVKQLSGDPWDDAGDKTTVGTIFNAEVVRFDEHAAFLSVCEGLEGRMHISEISEERVDSIRAALRMGQEVEVMTIRAERDRRRLDLSIKAVAAKIEADTPKSYTDEGPMNPMAAALAASGLAGGDEAEEAAPEAAAPEAAEAVVAAAEATEEALETAAGAIEAAAEAVEATDDAAEEAVEAAEETVEAAEASSEEADSEGAEEEATSSTEE